MLAPADSSGVFEERFRHLNERIELDGYFYLPKRLTEDEFESLASRLGGILSREDVRLHKTSFSVHRPEPLDFHTDAFEANWIGWYCVTPAESEGGTFLFDTRKLIADFSSAELTALARVEFRLSGNGKARATDPVQPLLTMDGGVPSVFCIPWLLPTELPEEENIVLTKFMRLLRLNQNNAVDIRLRKGECLFIDNRRMLHARGRLPVDSQRFLRRVLISRQYFRLEFPFPSEEFTPIREFMNEKGLLFPEAMAQLLRVGINASKAIVE